MNFDSGSIMSALDAEYLPQLEKDYCSNFICCGVPLADLHELVSHFEESHVTVLPPDGTNAQPDSPSDVSSPQTASSSSAFESPRSANSTPPPPPNLFPTLTSAFQPRESAFTPVTTTCSRDPEYSSKTVTHHLPRDEQYVFDSMLHSEAYDCNGSVGVKMPLDVYPHAQLCLPPAQVSVPPVHNSTTVAVQYATDNARQSELSPAYTHPPTIAPTPIYARPPTLSIITEPQDHPTPVKKRREDTRSRVSPSDQEAPSSPPRRRKVPTQKQPLREKTYKCPHAGCIKSYMNLNGLKYHLTKGACDFNIAR